MSCLLYNIAIEPLAEMIRKSTLRGFKIQGIQEKTLVSLFADDILVYMNKKDKIQTLERIISTFCKASTAKFNKEKTEILPIGSKKYREQIIEKRQTSESEEDKIPEEIRVVKDGETLRTLGSYMDNKVNQVTQWNQILKKQKDILDAWITLNLSTSGKELILKSLVQSRALFLATVNGIPKDIEKRMEKQMKAFLWDNKKATMNWKEASQPRKIGELNMPNIKTRIEAIQIMWLKKYLAPKCERPNWAYVVDQIIFNNLQKNPKIKKQNRISWIFQS